MNLIFVVSSPTGAGKTTLCDMIVKRMDDVRRVVTHTTRLPRPHEKDGVDYYFVSKEDFERSIEKGEFVEYAIVHGNYYGTSKRALREVLEGGFDALLAIDVQGAEKVIKQFDNVVSIFILPPSFEEWLERLKKDNTREDLDRRFKTSLIELEKIDMFDFSVVNDDLESAYVAMSCIIKAQRNNMRFAKEERIKLAREIRRKTEEFLREV